MKEKEKMGATAARTTTTEASGGKLLSQATCPHCWERFLPEQALWISEHVELLGDPMLGPEQQQRFLPSRFTLEGDAIDPRGMTARSLACPKCHLPVPRSMMEIEPLFLSILGAPSSGKSYFLTAMTWQLRKLLPLSFSISFTDADPAANRALNDCEESLFLNPRESTIVPLGDLIRKTELQGELYDSVSYGHQIVSYPRPFMFALQPRDGHVRFDRAAELSRVLCLYDNAGEHFQPGSDTTSSPVTRHLALSRAILFLFDPTQDKRFRAACRSKAVGPKGGRDNRLSRQETLLTEAAARIRKFGGGSQQARYDRPVVVVLSKFDEWSHLVEPADVAEPWRKTEAGAGVDVDRIEERSKRLRRILEEYCPETVAAADSFAQDVTYIAVSSLGNQIELDPVTGLPGVRPENLKPYWVTVPLLYCLSQVLPALAPRLRKRS